MAAVGCFFRNLLLMMKPTTMGKAHREIGGAYRGGSMKYHESSTHR
jgi:hypothetical protein